MIIEQLKEILEPNEPADAGVASEAMIRPEQGTESTEPPVAEEGTQSPEEEEANVEISSQPNPMHTAETDERQVATVEVVDADAVVEPPPKPNTALSTVESQTKPTKLPVVATKVGNLDRREAGEGKTRGGVDQPSSDSF